jgi:hypothetical protein
MTAALFILAVSVFLSFLAFGAFALLIVSIHRTPRVPMSETQGKRAGAFARCVIAGVRTESKEGDE